MGTWKILFFKTFVSSRRCNDQSVKEIKFPFLVRRHLNWNRYLVLTYGGVSFWIHNIKYQTIFARFHCILYYEVCDIAWGFLLYIYPYHSGLLQWRFAKFELLQWMSGNIRIYRQIFNIRRTKSQNLNVFRFVLQLSLHNLFKPGVKWGMTI